MKPYHLYVLTTPTVLRQVLGTWASKIGIAKNINGRNGDYQQAFGPVLEIDFTATWSGPENEIRWLESAVLKHFEHRVCANVRSLSEWVNGAEPEELIECVENFIKERNLSVKRNET